MGTFANVVLDELDMGALLLQQGRRLRRVLGVPLHHTSHLDATARDHKWCIQVRADTLVDPGLAIHLLCFFVVFYAVLI